MKILILILATLPLFAKAQITPDSLATPNQTWDHSSPNSLLGCYAGLFKHYENPPDTTWTTIFQDTLIVFKVDTGYVTYNGETYGIVQFNWLLKNEGTKYNDYRGYCTYGYGFDTCIYDFDTNVRMACNDRSDFMMFVNNDSIFYTNQCWAKSQIENQIQHNWFEGKKYTSIIPDSLLHIDVEETKKPPAKYVRIYPNPTTSIVKIDLLQQVKTKLELLNIEGQVIFTSEINTKNYILNLQQYKQGIYFIKLSNNKYTFTEKIIKL